MKRTKPANKKNQPESIQAEEIAMKTKSTKKSHKPNNVSTQTTETPMSKKKSKPSKTVEATESASAPATLSPSIAAVTTTTAPVPASTSSSTNLAGLVDDMTKFLDSAETRLGPEAPSLTGAVKRRTAKARKGADKIIGTIAPIVQQHQLESPTLSATQMLAQQQVASTLQPLQLRLQKVQKRVADEAFNAQNSAWAMGLQFYSLLRSRAKTDGTVATSLAPVKEMFNYRHPDVKATKPKKVQTRAKKKLKGAIELASKHGVAQGVLAEEAPLLAQGSGASATTVAPASVTSTAAVSPAPVATVNPPVAAPATSAAPAVSPAPASAPAVSGTASVSHS